MNRIAIVSAVLVAAPVLVRAQAASVDSSTWWRDAARKDLTAAREIMGTRFITALNSPDQSWTVTLDGAFRDAERDVERVRDAASYQSVMKRFVGAFDDAHVRVRFTSARALQQEWPGFLVRYDGRHFVVVESDRSDVRVGSAITGCDAKPIDQVLTETMPYEQVRRHLELESTRTMVGRILFVDAVGSLRPRPSRCRIAGHDVALNWQPIATDRLAKLNGAHAAFSDNVTSITTFGKNGAWVRMSTFGPSGESAKQFAKIIEQAPTIRGKDVIVFDVRGNGGGSYNWFMGFLDALYGEPYADYYARARLQFANVMSVRAFSCSRTTAAAAPASPSSTRCGGFRACSKSVATPMSTAAQDHRSIKRFRVVKRRSPFRAWCAKSACAATTSPGSRTSTSTAISPIPPRSNRGFSKRCCRR